MKDVELAPEERAVIAAGRAALDPTELQRARVRRGLDTKIAAGVAAPMLVTSSALAAVLKAGAGVAVVAALGTGVFYGVVLRPREPALPAPPTEPAHRSPAPPVTAPSPSVTAPPLSPTMEPAALPRPAPSRQRTTLRRSVAPTADLAGELALLTQANAATQAGQAAQANELLRAYDRAFPSGQLTQERVAAGILADCAAGRLEAARAAARTFVGRWPRSPLIARLRASCAREDLAP